MNVAVKHYKSTRVSSGGVDGGGVASKMFNFNHVYSPAGILFIAILILIQAISFFGEYI